MTTLTSCWACFCPEVTPAARSPLWMRRSKVCPVQLLSRWNRALNNRQMFAERVLWKSDQSQLDCSRIMRISSEEWRLSFFWLEAETNLCAQGSGLCGAAGGQVVPFPAPRALGPSRGSTSPGSTSSDPMGRFRSFQFLLASLQPLHWESGGRHCN